MSAERRRIIAVLAALVVLLAAGVFWLTRLVAGGPEPASFVPAATDPTSFAVPPATLPTTQPVSHADPTTRPGTPGATRTTKPATTPPVSPPRSPTPTPTVSVSPSHKPPPPPKTRVIQVGGVTLDNKNPRTMCTFFTNDRPGIDVTIGSVRVSGDLEIDAQDCGEDDQTAGMARCRTGNTLARGKSCYTGASPTTTEPGPVRGTVRLAVSALCESAGAAACSVPELKDDPPTKLSRVLVKWTQSSDTEVCYLVHAPDDEDQSKFCTG